jgi:DNA-binding CsgD family transcriptional regulator
MLQRTPQTFEPANDYAFMHGETYCGAVPEGDGSYPHHCLHGASTGDDLACCWCGDVFVGDGNHTVHGDNFHPLTKREVEVAQLLADGLINKTIAVKLKISPFTVNFHVDNIIKKLGGKNRVAAIAAAIRRGIIP